MSTKKMDAPNPPKRASAGDASLLAIFMAVSGLLVAIAGVALWWRSHELPGPGPAPTPIPTPVDERISNAKNIMERILSERKNLDNLASIVFVPEYTEDSEGKMTLNGLKEENARKFDGAPSIKTEYILDNLKDDAMYIGKNQAIESIERIIKESGSNVTSEKNKDNLVIGFELKDIKDWGNLPNKLLNVFNNPMMGASAQAVTIKPLKVEDVRLKLKDIQPQKNGNKSEPGYILFLFKTEQRGFYEALFIDNKGEDTPKNRYYADTDADIVLIDKYKLKNILQGKKNENTPCIEQGKESIANYYFWFGKPLSFTVDTNSDALIKEFAKSLVGTISLKL